MFRGKLFEMYEDYEGAQMLRGHCGRVSPGIMTPPQAGTRSKQGGCTQVGATTRQKPVS